MRWDGPAEDVTRRKPVCMFLIQRSEGLPGCQLERERGPSGEKAGFSDAAAAATLRWTNREATVVRIDRLDGAAVGRLGELACLMVGKTAIRNIPAVAVRSWYDKRDARAPDGLLPLALFSRVHIAHAEGYVWLVPAPHIDTRSAPAYTFPHTQA